MAATSAANAAFPRSPLNSPGIEGQQQQQQQPHASPKPASSTPELPQLQKPKEGKSRLGGKLFSSKPKNIKVDNMLSGKDQALPSPGKIGIGIHSSQSMMLCWWPVPSMNCSRPVQFLAQPFGRLLHCHRRLEMI